MLVFSDLLETIEEILPNIPEGISVWAMKDSVPQGIISLKEKLSTASDKPIPRSRLLSANLKSTCLYIFTSGTTGTIHCLLTFKSKEMRLQSNITLDQLLPCVILKTTKQLKSGHPIFL